MMRRPGEPTDSSRMLSAPAERTLASTRAEQVIRAFNPATGEITALPTIIAGDTESYRRHDEALATLRRAASLPLDRSLARADLRGVGLQ